MASRQARLERMALSASGHERMVKGPTAANKEQGTRNNGLISPQEARKIERFMVDYALGSGHHATTFVTVLDLDPPKILEHRLTYYTREGPVVL